MTTDLYGHKELERDWSDFVNVNKESRLLYPCSCELQSKKITQVQAMKWAKDCPAKTKTSGRFLMKFTKEMPVTALNDYNN